jgi:predicted nucleotidyltransferase
MAKKRIYDPYAEAIDRFNRKGVRYVIVGMAGINYYASDARETFSTQDFDIFVKPTIPNVKKAVSIFRELGYSVAVKGKPAQDERIKDAVRRKDTFIATDAYGVMFELILAVSGYTFAQMETDAVIFDVSRVPVKVARLGKLLMSKKAAGRDKDRLFLKRFGLLLKKMS